VNRKSLGGEYIGVSTDSEIIERSVRDPRAFTEIFERHARPVGGYISKRVGVDAVDDVLSETFLIAFRKRSSYDTTWSDARPWLLGIATRVVNKHRVAQARQWRALEAAARAPDVPEDAHSGTDSRLDATAAIRALAPRIAALAKRDRDTLLLYAWEDLTYDQIAVALDVPVGTVRSRLNRVRRKLAPFKPNTESERGHKRVEEDTDGRYGNPA